jgi:hypothetical protein
MASTSGSSTGDAATVTQPEDFENIFFDEDTLPGADTNIGNIISTTSVEDQRTQCIDFYSFLTNENRQLSQLNLDTVARVAIIGMPGSPYIKVVYGSGIGVSPIGQTTAIDDKLLVLHGDGGPDIGTPQPFTLPITTLNKNVTATMTTEQFRSTVTARGPDFQHPLLTRNRVLTEQDIMQISPIPAYLVYDGFNKDLHAGLILERLFSIETEGIEMFQHLQSFLLSCLSAHSQNDNKPYIAQQHLLNPPTAPARIWAGKKFKALFPGLIPDTTATPAAAAANPGAANVDLAAILAQLLPLQQQALQLQINRPQERQHQYGEEKKDDDTTILGMSKQELSSTLIMCGKNPNDHHSFLPQWFHDCAEKGMTESYRLRIIRKHIMNTFKYDDAEVPVTATLLKNINKRNWLGKDGNIKRPSLLNASEGLSPFIVLDLDEDEVARINDTEDALTRASTVTMQDIANLKKKLTPKVPTTADEFMLLLKRFANLIFALFSEDCPFFQCIVKIINALKEFSRSARESMTTRTRASIMWIILLQSRNFALGDDKILAEFTAMHANLSSKQGNIFHSEVPQALLVPKVSQPSNPTKRKNPMIDTPAEKPEIKKPRKNLNNWHPSLKEKLEDPLKKAGNPSFTTIMQYVDADPADVISDKSSWCTPNAYFGKCFLGEKCRRQHKIVTDAQADKILVQLEKFITKPEDIKAKG